MRKETGFTLTEVLMTIVIVGILSAVALPNYFRQMQRTRQNEAASVVANLQTTIATYNDEFGITPSTWKDVNDISSVMTDEGPASSTDELDEAITLINGYYTLTRLKDESGSTFTLIAEPTGDNDNNSEFNVMACIDLNTGASDLRLGSQGDIDGAVEEDDLRC